MIMRRLSIFVFISFLFVLITTPRLAQIYAAEPSSLRCDGGNDYVQTVNLPLATQFTIEAWVKRTADNNNYQTFLSDANSSYTQTMFALYVDAGGADCGAGDQFAYYQINGSSLQCSGRTAEL